MNVKIKNHYVTYKLNEWINIFKNIDDIKEKYRKFIKTTSDKFNINYSTLKNKYHIYCKNNKNNNMLNTTNFLIDKRGNSNFLLTDIEEQRLYDYLTLYFISTNSPLNNNMIMNIATIMFKDKIKIINDNTFSHNWCTLFKKRNSLSTCRIKFSKIATTIVTDNKINKFLYDCQRLIKIVGVDNFFNFDETPEHIANPPKTAIRKTNSKNIKINTHNNLKENVTACITESLNGTFLNTIIIIKGKTERSFKKYGQIPNNLSLSKSISGWITFEIMKQILKQIYEKTRGFKSVLVLDRFGVHMLDLIKNDAKNKNIILLFVPEGLTSKYQPLDYSINAILKEKLQNKYTKFIIKNINVQYTLNNFLIDFSNSLLSIDKNIIIKSFDCLKKSIVNPVIINT